jgi:hypothetical protein
MVYILFDMSNPEILELLNKMKTEFYVKEGSKNVLFKKSQKLKCAETISNQIDLNTLLSHSAYFLPNQNKIYFDYTVFKLYANDSNYVQIIQYFIQLVDAYIDSRGEPFELHLNLNGFTISAAERYKEAVQLFCESMMYFNQCKNRQLVDHLSKLYIYYTPAVMDTIMRLFHNCIDPTIYKRITFISKDESPQQIKALFEPTVSESYASA